MRRRPVTRRRLAAWWRPARARARVGPRPLGPRVSTTAACKGTSESVRGSVGWADTRNVSMPLNQVTGVSVSLNLSGGWNGDLYAYLVHNSGFAVLLNRVGSTAANEAGFSTAGLMHVTLDDTALLNIHSVAEPAAWGHYRSDSRNISPLSSGALFDATTPGAMLTSFNGLDPNGSWTLFIADASGGDQSVLTSWTLAAVPEPGSAEMGAIAVLFLGAVIGVYRLKGQKTLLQRC